MKARTLTSTTIKWWNLRKISVIQFRDKATYANLCRPLRAWKTNLKGIWILEFSTSIVLRYMTDVEHLRTRFDPVVESPAEYFSFSKWQTQNKLKTQEHTQDLWRKKVERTAGGLTSRGVLKKVLLNDRKHTMKKIGREVENGYCICHILK